MMKKWQILVHFIENFNDEMALLTKILNPKEVVLVTNAIYNPSGKLQQVIAYIEYALSETKINVVTYDEEEPLTLTDKLLPYIKKEAAINLGGTSPLEALLVANLEAECTMFYPSMRHNRLYIFEKGQVDVKVLSKEIGSLAVEDYLTLGGGAVLQDEKGKYETPLYEKMLSYLLTYYKTYFSKIRHLFKPTYLHFSEAGMQDFYFEIVSSMLTKDEKQALKHYLTYLKEAEWIKRFEVTESVIRVYAQNKELEHYLSSGAWLEHVTYYYMKQIKGVSDVHTGFKFAWHIKEKHVHNELDVVGALENHLVCISCKDTDKYDYQTLNELEVYATRLGGAESVKVLVTTMPPVKSSTLDRAKGMGIHIIQIEDELGVLSDKLKALV